MSGRTFAHPPARHSNRMKSASVVRVGGAAVALCAALAGGAPAQNGPGGLAYPPTPRGNRIEEIGGVRIADPYAWLENVSSPEVRSWTAAQNAVTQGYLSRLPRHHDVSDLLARSASYPWFSAPVAAGDRLFYLENPGLDNQPTLRVQDRPEVAPRTLIDPNVFSLEGLIAIVDLSPSPDGRYLAYTVSTQATADRLLRVRDMRTNLDLADELHDVKDSSVAWTHDERGFFYVRTDIGRPAGAPALAPYGRQSVFYHRVGRAQSADQTIYENTDHPERRYDIVVSQDGQYLVIRVRAGGVGETESQDRLYLIDLDNPGHPNLGAPLVKLLDAGDAAYDFAANNGPVFYIRTNRDAPRRKLVAVDINAPDPSRWTTVIRETYDPLIGVRRVDDRLLAHRLHDAHSVLELYGLDGTSRGIVQLPGVGTVTEINPDPDGRDVYLTYTSFLQPPAVYRYGLDSRNLTPFKEVRADTLAIRFETTQLFFTSKDGTRVPMFITAKRGIVLDGSHATLLAGGGGFNTAATPVFAPEVAAWLELGGIYAVANVRGGGEYGRAWHDAATGERKQVAIDDLIAAAEFLIDQRYTRSALLGVTGSGHAGLVAAAAMTRRPSLFAAVAIEGGLFDMSRFNRFTDGAAWTAEYGSPDRASDLRAMLAYSPLQAVADDVGYPATFLTAGDHDEVIPPWQSFKFAAALQHGRTAGGPALLRVEYNEGSGPGISTSKRLAAGADRLTFLISVLRASR